MTRKRFPHYWPFVGGIHRSPLNSPHKGQANLKFLSNTSNQQFNHTYYNLTSNVHFKFYCGEKMTRLRLYNGTKYKGRVNREISWRQLCRHWLSYIYIYIYIYDYCRYHQWWKCWHHEISTFNVGNRDSKVQLPIHSLNFITSHDDNDCRSFKTLWLQWCHISSMASEIITENQSVCPTGWTKLNNLRYVYNDISIPKTINRFDICSVMWGTVC